MGKKKYVNFIIKGKDELNNLKVIIERHGSGFEHDTTTTEVIPIMDFISFVQTYYLLSANVATEIKIEGVSNAYALKEALEQNFKTKMDVLNEISKSLKEFGVVENG